MVDKESALWSLTGAGDPKIQEAGRRLAQGALVAFPTETVYGLGANGLDPQAVEKIFTAKGRPQDNPLILHVASLEAARELALDWSDTAQCLAESFWPGPLTLVVPAQSFIPAQVTAGLPTVALRMPDHPVALALLKAAGVPVAAPSANRSGRPSPTQAIHVLEDLPFGVEIILDGGPCRVGLESTIVDVSVDPPKILRPGEITQEALIECVGPVLTHRDSSPVEGPKAPGMKYRHYAPKAPVTLLEGSPEKIKDFVLALEGDTSVVFLAFEETLELLARDSKEPAAELRSMGSRTRLQEMGRRLYDELRRCDQTQAEAIYIEACPPQGYGAALMNRLLKASAERVLHL